MWGCPVVGQGAPGLGCSRECIDPAEEEERGKMKKRAPAVQRRAAAVPVLAAALALLSAPAQAASPRGDGQAAATPSSGARATAFSTAVASTTARCRKAKRRVKRASRRLRKARRSSDKKTIEKAKRVVRRAKKRRRRACAKGTARPNRPPHLPDALVDFDATHFGFNHYEGALISEIAHIAINPATDPDGDPLTYGWSASQAPRASYESYICAGAEVFGRDCAGSGPDPAATWVVYADSHGCIPEGHAVVTVSDGKGGTDEAAIPFAVGVDCSAS
jgi:hypothetical protein